MEDFGVPNKKGINLVPFILIFGFILGGVLSWVFNPAPSPTASRSTSTPKITLTDEFLLPTQMTEITPQVIYQSSAASKGHPAPDFTLKTMDGEEHKLSDDHGKPVLINFWTTWCPPCKSEMPDIQAAYEKYQDKGFTVLSVNFTAEDKIKDVSDFIAKYRLTFPVLLDNSGDVTAELYGVVGLPVSFFIDHKGVIRHIEVGGLRPEVIDQYIQEILP